MAWRANADNQDYYFNGAWGATTQWSITCWAQISTDRNAASTVWDIDSGATSDYYLLRTATDGTTMSLVDETGVTKGGLAMTVGAWYYIGVAVNGAAGTFISRPATSNTFTTVTWASGMSASTNIQWLGIGESVFNGQWLNGCVAAFKFWRGATLSVTELQNESYTFMPRRFANLLAWFPFDNPSQFDFSGAGTYLSGGGDSPGTRTGVKNNPPISWGSMATMRKLWAKPDPPPVQPFQGWGVPI